MRCNIKNFSNILYVADINVDDSESFKQVIALKNNTQANLSIICIIDTSYLNESSVYHSESLKIMIEKRKDFINTLLDEHNLKDSTVETHVVVGREFIQVIHEILKNNYDLVVKSIDENASITQRFFSGSDMRLLRKCPCPIWLIKSTKQIGDREVLVALDYQPDNAENDELNLILLEVSSSLALADFSELHIVHVWKLPYESYLRGPRTAYSNADIDNMIEEERVKREGWLSNLLKNIDTLECQEYEGYLKPTVHLLQGDAKQVIPEVVKKLGVELVVMGTVARTGIPGFVIGNTAESILNQLECSVLALKPDGFVSPITL